MVIALLILAGVGFFLSLIVQVGTYLGVGIGVSLPVVRCLHLGLFIVYGLVYAYNKKIDNEYWKKAIACTPKILNFLLFLVLIYATFHISIGIYGFFRYGKLAKSQGQKVLLKRGRVVSVLSEEEYATQYDQSLRRISSAWMAAYLIPLNSSIGSLVLRKRQEDTVE